MEKTIPHYVKIDLDDYWKHMTNNQDPDGCPPMRVLHGDHREQRWILRGEETDWIVVWEGKGDGITQLTVYGEPEGYYLIPSPAHKIIQSGHWIK
jgi:hypothetical protein